MDKNQFDELIKRLDKVVLLCASNLGKDKTTTERVLLLDTVGFSPSDIGKIIGESKGGVESRLRDAGRCDKK